MTERVLGYFRASPWLFISLLLVLLIWWIAPYQIGVLLWSLAKLTLATYAGYWIFRTLHPYARPHELEGEDRRNAMFVRGLLIAAAIIALGLGV